MRAVIERGWDLSWVVLLIPIVRHDMCVREHGPGVADDGLHLILVSSAPQKTFACSIPRPGHRWIRVPVQLSHEMVLPQSRSLLARQRHAGARLDVFIEVLQCLLPEETYGGLSTGLRPRQVRLWLFHRHLFLNCVHLSFWL